MARTTTRIGTRLDRGRQRSHNEDSLRCRQPMNDTEAREFGDLFVLADGMGGHAAGEVASQLAVDTIISAYFSQPSDDIRQSLTEAIESANQIVYQQATDNLDLNGMGTTCVCSAIHGDELYTAHVGDSRAYLFRKGNLEQITQDHSWVEEQVRHGILSADEARSHPMKNVITRALGSAPEVKIDLSVRKIKEGDVLLICSDGLTGPVGDEAITEVLRSQPDPQAAVDALVDLANDAGGPDNIGIIAVRVDKVVPISTNGTRRRLRTALQKGLTRLQLL